MIGGGAAGFFAALTAAERGVEVILLEKTRQLLAKVKISGGGRCNVTHACFDNRQLVTNYPRGNLELLGPFSRFGPRDTVEWFERHSVPLKVEDDGRMFPVSNSSQSIIDCLHNEAKKRCVEIRLEQKITALEKGFVVTAGETFSCDRLLLATGSSPQGYAFARHFGHTIVPPVPSLFTFHVPTSPLLDLSGIAVQDVELSLMGLYTRGPLLITHFGFSGPAVLRLSAFAARLLHESGYTGELSVDWLPGKVLERTKSGKAIGSLALLPKQLWKRMLELCSIDPLTPCAHLSNSEWQSLDERLHTDRFSINGKSPYKEEFVTAGGVALKEINFKTMESRLVPGLHFAGEILDIDGVTGGFNFQNAWTTGYLAGLGMVK